MNIGFYGKGGSGKTTLSALFALWLDDQGYMVGLLDVDVNSHTAEVVGVEPSPNKILSDEFSRDDIRQYLAGANVRIKKNEFLNTTPPGTGSGVWTMRTENYITKRYGHSFGSRSHVFTTGSYNSDKIGIACHHDTQSVAENMISHAKFTEKDILVVDSVAGNDAFGTTLYLNDLLVFVLKPEREGVAVLRRFLALAERAGVRERVVVVVNQVSSDVQRSFLDRELSDIAVLGVIEMSDYVMDSRLNDRPLDVTALTPPDVELFRAIVKHTHRRTDSYQSLIRLHRAVASEQWVAGAYRTGLDDQIDMEYQP